MQQSAIRISFVFVIYFQAVQPMLPYKCLYDVYYFDLTYELPNDSFNFTDLLVCGLEYNCEQYKNWKNWSDECRLQKEYLTCDFTLLEEKDFEMKILGRRKNDTVEVIQTIRHSKPQPCDCFNVKELLPKEMISLFKDGVAVFYVDNMLQNVDPSFLTYSIKLYEGDSFVKDIMTKDISTRDGGTGLEINVNDLKDCHFYNLKFSFNYNRCQVENENVFKKKFQYYVKNQESCNTTVERNDGLIKLKLSTGQIIFFSCCLVVVVTVLLSVFCCYFKKMQNLNTSSVDVRQYDNQYSEEHLYAEIDMYST